MSNYARFVPIQTQPIRLDAVSDMGHFILNPHNPTDRVSYDPVLYQLAMNDIDSEYQTRGGYDLRFYHAKKPNQVKEYQINGQTYIVDFTHM